MTRRVLTMAVLVVAGLVTLTATAWAADVGFGGLEPSSGPPGSSISYSVVGSPNAGAECSGSSAFSTEFLAGDGVRLGTGATTIDVPAGAATGHAFVRLICYVSDVTGRRVIRGVCTGFDVTAPGTGIGPKKVAAPGATIDEPCPASGRLVVSQAVIRAQTHLGEAFNQVLTHLAP